MTTPDPLSPPRSPASTLPTPNAERLMAKARELEAAFLSEMLAHGGLGKTSDSFGGGAGEEQFASFLRQEQARLMVDKGGIGLAESIFTALVKAEGARRGATD